MSSLRDRSVIAAVTVASLGYFVDVYDLLLFSVLRRASLLEIGVPEAQLLDTGATILQWQMAGMLLGGVLWGVLGDKKGRLSVLFGSILLYSTANIGCGLVNSVWAYALARFLGGFGLAGELGAGITLVSEILPKHTRGYSTTIIATVGVMGGVAAGVIGELTYWRTSYFIGGVLGLALFVLRLSVRESGMFTSVRERGVSRGNLLMLFSTRERLTRYLACLLMGFPPWYVVGILVSFAPEFGKAFGMETPPTVAKAVLFSYIGITAGDLASGLLSQFLKSRKKALGVFLGLTALMTVVYLLTKGASLTYYYTLCVLLGFSVGFWAVFITSAAEQFGTNLRATVATTVPNFARGALVPITALFTLLKEPFGIVGSAIAVGVICSILSLGGLAALKETYGRDLDFVEGDT